MLSTIIECIETRILSTSEMVYVRYNLQKAKEIFSMYFYSS